ncbi:MAG TPA: GIY-YIG nuclease family protein [Puia sp.]|jgi:hypothetical protein
MAKNKKLTEEDNELLAELGIDIDADKTNSHNVREERIISGFEDIQKFVIERGRLPEHGEDKDIFERLYAIRLDQICKHEEYKILLKNLDHQNLLDGKYNPATDIPIDIDDADLLAQLGVEEIEENSITNLKHVKSRAEKRAAEEIANRTRCEDFDQFKLLFAAIKQDIDSGYRITVPFRKDAGFAKTTLKKGQFLIIGGQIAFIAEIGETFKAPNGDDDARLRVIYANGTESNILLRSLFRAMYKDETSRFITEPDLGPLFSGENSEDDQESGTIYVLRSLSDHPMVIENRNIVHKIGVTGGDVKKRLVNAKNDPTFLFADVEIIATYKLANINRTKLEKIIHRFFTSAKLEIEMPDRFGRLVKAQEWFMVPVFIIDEMVKKIIDGTISDYYYDTTSVQLMRS